MADEAQFQLIIYKKFHVIFCLFNLNAIGFLGMEIDSFGLHDLHIFSKEPAGGLGRRTDPKTIPFFETFSLIGLWDIEEQPKALAIGSNGHLCFNADMVVK